MRKKSSTSRGESAGRYVAFRQQSRYSTNDPFLIWKVCAPVSKGHTLCTSSSKCNDHDQDGRGLKVKANGSQTFESENTINATLLKQTDRKWLRGLLLVLGALALQLVPIRCVISGGIDAGQIQSYYVHRDSANWDNATLIITMVTVPPGQPVCTYGSKRFAARLNSNFGRSIYQTVMLAKATGQNVSVLGTNACSDWGDSESIVWLNLN
jgi:hypothetical protein